MSSVLYRNKDCSTSLSVFSERTLTGVLYLNMLEEFLMPTLEEEEKKRRRRILKYYCSKTGRLRTLPSRFDTLFLKVSI
jgi:hypothetical protein